MGIEFFSLFLLVEGLWLRRGSSVIRCLIVCIFLLLDTLKNPGNPCIGPKVSNLSPVKQLVAIRQDYYVYSQAVCGLSFGEVLRAAPIGGFSREPLNYNDGGL